MARRVGPFGTVREREAASPLYWMIELELQQVSLELAHGDADTSVKSQISIPIEYLHEAASLVRMVAWWYEGTWIVLRVKVGPLERRATFPPSPRPSNSLVHALQ